MKRLLLLLPVLALGACRDNGASVQIQSVCAFNSACTFAGGKCETVALGNPVIDTSVTGVLVLVLQLENQLTDNTNVDLRRLNTNDAHVDRVEIEYGGLLGGKVTLGAQGFIPAANTGLVWIEIIPATVGDALPTPPAFPNFASLTANVRFSGYLDDGTRFETAQFPLSIDVTTGGGTATCTTGYCPKSGQWPATCAG